MSSQLSRGIEIDSIFTVEPLNHNYFNDYALFSINNLVVTIYVPAYLYTNLFSH